MTENWKIGRLLRTTLMSTDFPAWLSQEKPQAWILSLKFSNRGSQSLLKADFWKIGRPRYLKEDQLEEAAKPKHLEMALRALAETFQQ
jgi:hypothetical protein